MSLLWKENIKKLLIISKRPSPRHNNRIPCFAQSIQSFQLNKFPLSTKNSSIKGISLLISRQKCLPGSMTVEAAIVLPIFLFFFLNLGSAIEMIRLHCNLEMALWEVGNRVAVYGHVIEAENLREVENDEIYKLEQSQELDEAESVLADIGAAMFGYGYIKGQIMEYTGIQYLESSPLHNGAEGLRFAESAAENGCIDVVLTYQVSPFGSMPGFRAFKMANRYYGHLWTGYQIPQEQNSQDQYVFITENGEVYHEDRACTHLKLSVSRVSFADAYIGKNAQGSSYTVCHMCCDGAVPELVYVTEEGDHYHYVRECPGLKRTVYKLPISQADQYRACSRCGA